MQQPTAAEAAAAGKKVTWNKDGGGNEETPEDGIWEEVHEARGSLSEHMRTGGICFSWECGRNLKKVPYFIVPDAWAKDPALVERVAEGLKLKVLRHSVLPRRGALFCYNT
jgi:hypothetical protein